MVWSSGGVVEWSGTMVGVSGGVVVWWWLRDGCEWWWNWEWCGGSGLGCEGMWGSGTSI